MSASDDDALRVILTTTETPEDARALAAGLLEAGLAACVQCSEIRSLYVWDGAVQDDPEVRLMIKTPASRCAAALDWLRGHHPYEVPQLVVLEAVETDAPYLAWAREVTAPGRS
jgi:periplasmic divalent cation tolerance protein